MVVAAVDRARLSACRSASCRRSTSTARLDYALSGFTIFLISTPTFVLGLVALYLFGVTLKVLPVGELFTFGKEDDLVDRVAHIVMPAMILGLANAALLMRYTRASMLEVLGSDYITTARAKGLVEPGRARPPRACATR